MNIVKQWINENFDTQYFENEEVDFKDTHLFSCIFLYECLIFNRLLIPIEFID